MTTPLTAPPYGRDNSATTQIFRDRTASGTQLIGEALYRRLTTKRGALLDVLDPVNAANYGFDLADQLNAAKTDAELAALGSQIAGECEKDPRVDSATVTVIRTSPSSFSVTIQAFSAAGAVDLAISVQDLTVTLLGAPQ